MVQQLTLNDLMVQQIITAWFATIITGYFNRGTVKTNDLNRAKTISEWFNGTINYHWIF